MKRLVYQIVSECDSLLEGIDFLEDNYKLKGKLVDIDIYNSGKDQVLILKVKDDIISFPDMAFIAGMIIDYQDKYGWLDVDALHWQIDIRYSMENEFLSIIEIKCVDYLS
jgi:hypothetical protein